MKNIRITTLVRIIISIFTVLSLVIFALLYMLTSAIKEERNAASV